MRSKINAADANADTTDAGVNKLLGCSGMIGGALFCRGALDGAWVVDARAPQGR